MVRSSKRRAPPLAPAAAGLAPGTDGVFGPLGEAPVLELPVLDLDLVMAALVDGVADEAEAELDAMPAWMDGEADTAAESMIMNNSLVLN